MNEKKAKEIFRRCEEIEALAQTILSYSAFVKAEMKVYLGGVGTTLDKRNKSKFKSEQEARIRAEFRRK